MYTYVCVPNTSHTPMPNVDRIVVLLLYVLLIAVIKHNLLKFWDLSKIFFCRMFNKESIISRKLLYHSLICILVMRNLTI